MIGWLLQRLEIDPTESFSERELRRQDAGGFAELRRDRILRRDPIPPGPIHRIVDGRSVIYIQTPDGDRVGVDPDDPESDAVAFEEAACWRLHVPSVAEGLRRMHRLSGHARQIDERLHLLGERVNEDRTVEGWVLAFLRPDSQSVGLLASLPTLAGERYRRFHVLCPTFQLVPTDRALLRAAGVFVSPLSVPSTTPPAPPEDWSHSALYDSITWDGRTHILTKTEAAVVKALDEARLRGYPVLSLREIADAADRLSVRRLRDLLSQRNRDLLRTLIAAEGPGRYRLNVARPPD